MNKQAPLAKQLPRALKRAVGRTAAPQVPAHVRVIGVELDQAQRADIRQALGAKLGKFARSIERVSVRVADVNGPRGGVDKMCRIKVVLHGLPSVIFETQSSTLNDAINGALAGTERSVRRRLQRRQARPRKAGTNAGALPLTDAPRNQEP